MGCKDGGGREACLGVPASCLSRLEFLSEHPCPILPGTPWGSAAHALGWAGRRLSASPFL